MTTAAETDDPGATRFPCFLYHGIGPERRLGYLDADRFRAHVETLLDAGFVIEGFDGVLRRLASGAWPGRYAVFSFDDGHRSTVRALDILAEFGAGATLFVATGACRSDARYLDADELRRLAAHTHIGSHTVTHRRLDRLPAAEVREELTASKAWLEDVTGRGIESFSAPSGGIDRRVLGLARDAGYELVGDSIPWWNRPEAVAEHRTLHRVALDYAFADDEYLELALCRPRRFWPRRARSLALAAPKRVLFSRPLRRIRGPVLSLWKRWR